MRRDGFGIFDVPEEVDEVAVEPKVRDINKQVNESALKYIIPISITVGVTLALLTDTPRRRQSPARAACRVGLLLRAGSQRYCAVVFRPTPLRNGRIARCALSRR